MAATTGYQAGVESTGTQLSYAPESAWGTAPSVAYQAIRYTSESLSISKTRQRPSEIIASGVLEASQALTTQVGAGGAINFALSYGTFDDLLAGALQADWQAAQTIAGVAADITLTLISGQTGTLSSTTSTKFQNISVGQWIRTLGFTNAQNNLIAKVTAKASNQSITISGIAANGSAAAIVTETPALTAAQVRASTIVNGSTFKSFAIQKQFSASLFLEYAGCFINGFSLSGGVGQFLSGSLNVVAKTETSATTNASTGAVLAAPTGTGHDPIGGFLGVFTGTGTSGATKFGSVVDSFSINASMSGAQAEYGMGSSAAQGMVQGVLGVSGSLKAYFKDFTAYTLATNETASELNIITKDAAGNAYVVTMLNAILVNPKIVAGGPSQPVMATFDIEANPQSAGGTIRIDRLPAV